MSKKSIAIFIGSLTLLTGGAVIKLQSGLPINVQEVMQVDFEKEVVVIRGNNIELITTQDAFGNIIKQGLRIPVKYTTIVKTETGFEAKEVEEFIEMTLDGYNSCRASGESAAQCKLYLIDDIQQNIQTKQENVKREIEELRKQQFSEEINISNF